MSVKLRTVIFSNKVTIENVPIYACSSCDHCEILPEVKPTLTELIRRLGDEPDKQTIRLDELNELALLLCEAVKQEKWNVSLEEIVKDRVNELLDLLLLAQTLQDEAWIEDIQERLTQIAKCSITT